MPGTDSEKVREVSRWSQHCKLRPESGHRRGLSRFAWFPIGFGRPIFDRPIFDRIVSSSFTVSLVPE